MNKKGNGRRRPVGVSVITSDMADDNTPQALSDKCIRSRDFTLSSIYLVALECLSRSGQHAGN